MNIAKYQEQLKCIAPVQYTRALMNEFVVLPLTQRIVCLLHTAALLSVTLYFTEMPSEEEFVFLASAYADDDLDDSDEEKSSSLNTYIETTKLDCKRFLTAARQAPRHAILPFFFVMYVGVLNILSYFVRNAPMTRRSWKFQHKRLSEKFGDPRWIRDFTLDLRPLYMGWVVLVPPITIFNMMVNTIRVAISPFKKKNIENKIFGIPCLRLVQQRAKQIHTRNFYFSPWFSITIMVPFILGIPGAISLWIYWHLGIDPLLNFPSSDVDFHQEFVIIHLYVYSLAACLSLLFFRSYFLYPWNFCSTEFEIEIYDDVIKQLPIKGWFMDFFTMRQFHTPKQIAWSDVSSIEFSGGKLKTNLAATQNSAMMFFNKMSSIYESVTSKLEIHSETLTIASKYGRTIHINLWELTPDEKLELFHKLRKNAPSIYLDEQVQNALTGSTVLREPRYTEIWFSVLKGNSTILPEGDLKVDRSLRDGRYKIKSKIASGGQAVVYLAADETDKTVVLKEFQLTTGESLNVQIESAKDFENESAILDQLSHPAIVKSLDMFYEEGRVYLVLENVEGRSLRQVVSEDGPRAKSEIFGLAEQMCDILKYLHGQEPPVVHRDFTPDNIILQPDGKLKLIDFSVAQRAKEVDGSNCAGKHSYTPPEQFRGAASPQSDIYAFGATLFYLATGKDPLPISTSGLVANSDAETDLLSEIISSSTELNLSKRYESIEWVLLTLQKYKANETYSGPRIVLPKPEKKILQFHTRLKREVK